MLGVLFIFCCTHFFVFAPVTDDRPREKIYRQAFVAAFEVLYTKYANRVFARLIMGEITKKNDHMMIGITECCIVVVAPPVFRQIPGTRYHYHR